MANWKPTAVSTGHATKAHKESKARQESLLKVDSSRLMPPAWLSDAGREEFMRVVREAQGACILDNLDLSALATYAEAYAHVQTLFTTLNEEGDLNGGSRSFTNPALKPLEMYVKTMMQCSAKLGLYSVDRLKLIVPEKAEKKPKNPFLKFVDGDETFG